LGSLKKDFFCKASLASVWTTVAPAEPPAAALHASSKLKSGSSPSGVRKLARSPFPA